MDLVRQALRFPRKESGHFLSLIGGVSVLVLVFFLIVHSPNRAEVDGVDDPPPTWRRDALQIRGSSSQAEEAFGTYSSIQQPVSDKQPTLVIYLYSHSDPVYQNNLQYFIRRGVSKDDGNDYVFVIQEGEGSQGATSLPQLPPNAQYYYPMRQGCQLGWGILGEVLNSTKVVKENYKYFIFMNSSVRGPFIPTFALEEKHWSRYFTQKLVGNTKLVGPTISCHSPKNASLASNTTLPPHVQFTVVATDVVGLRILEMQGTIFRCHASTWEEQFFSEMGSSRAILEANYTLDSFMTKYRKVDWRDSKNWNCNQGKNPIGEFCYDGTSINPYETMFVVMDTVAIENGWSFAKSAALYETWLTLQDQGSNEVDVNGNLWMTDPWPIKRQRIAYMQSRGPGCFDNRYYLQKNPDLKVIPTVLELWDHFVMLGQFEGRSFRWSCEDDRKLPWE